MAAAGLGYAPPGWTALGDHLRARGYTDEQLLQAALASPTRRRSIADRFRARVTVPVLDHAGRHVAFIARAWSPATTPGSRNVAIMKISGSVVLVTGAGRGTGR